MVKRRKKSKNKFKPNAAEPAAASPAQQQLHAVASGDTAKKKKKQKKQQQQKQRAAIGKTVATQSDSLVALPPQSEAVATAAAPAAAAWSSETGRSSFLSCPSGKKGKDGGSLLQQLRKRLQGSRFRWINEMLYTSDSAAALDMMQKQPDLVDQYHEGFREQTKGWPVQPVDQAICWLHDKPPGWAVADLGCGDARIAATVTQKVHSFDLSATAPGVVACNMADVSLAAGTVDATIFCLSLMGTDYGAFLAEAARILKPSGWLWVAEVRSRFVDGGGRDVLPTFLAALAQLGFALKRKDTSNSHFLVLELQRQGQQRPPNGGVGSSDGQLAWPQLRACQYKKR